MRRATLTALLFAAGLCACRRARAPAAPEVAVYLAPSEPAGKALLDLAALRGVARARLVPLEQAQVAWFGDPSEAIEAQGELVAGAAPAQDGVDARWRDGKRRFAPLCARARVIVARDFATAEKVRDLRELAAPTLTGQIALAPLGEGEGPVTVAALALAYGVPATGKYLELLAHNHPRLARDDDTVRVLVAGGAARVGLTGSEAAAAAATSAASLEVVYPDQGGKGTLVLPTAVALTKRGEGVKAAVDLLAWLAGPEAERLLVARAPGHLPLRDGVPVPVGVHPANNVRAMMLDWDALAAARRELAPALAGWPGER